MDLRLLWLLPPLLLCLIAGAKKAYDHRGEAHAHHHGIGHKHGEATISIDIYAYKSGISQWNPGFKVGFSIFLLLLCVIANNVYVSAVVILITTYITVILGGLDFHHYVDLLTIPLVFLIVGSIAILINFSWTWRDDAILNLYCFHSFYIFVTMNGLRTTLYLWGRAFGAISAMYMMSLSTMSHEISGVLRKCHFPKLFVELMNMIYRSIFIMMDTQARMKNSAVSRLGYRDVRTSINSFGNTASNLLIVSMKRGSQLFDAMEARCYDGDLLFLEDEKPVTRSMAALAAVTVVYLALVYVMTTRGIGFYG